MCMSLKQRLIILSLSLAVIPALTVGIVSYELARSGVYCQINNKLKEETAMLKDQIKNILAGS